MKTKLDKLKELIYKIDVYKRYIEFRDFQKMRNVMNYSIFGLFLEICLFYGILCLNKDRIIYIIN